MKRFVLDCSVTMTWCFEDENSEYADTVMDSLQDCEAVVPSIWVFEVANVLAVAERRNRLKRGGASRFLGALGMLKIVVDDPPDIDVIPRLLALGRSHRLSSYDAAYLDLAMREAITLATLDNRLRAAAKDVGIATFDP